MFCSHWREKDNCFYFINWLCFQANFDEIRAYLDIIERDTLFLNTSVQQKWDIFDEKIKECEAKFISTKMIVKNFDSKFKDILPQYVREKIKQKHNLWKRYMETRLSKYYTDYCSKIR